MSRLITFGDSFTYGHGLPDCHVPPNLAGPEPSKLSWAQLLGNMLDIEVVNKSKPGHSNIEILRDILNFKDISSSDIVVVGWTYALRDCIFKKNLLGNDISFRISPWHNDESFVKKWLSVHNDYDLSVRAGLYMHHAECFLKTKQINQYHFCAYWGVFEVMPDFTIVPDSFINQKILSRIDRALDNDHPGVNSHQQAAEKLYEIINASK